VIPTPPTTTSVPEDDIRKPFLLHATSYLPFSAPTASEWTAYQAEPNVLITVNPLEWWKISSYKYPILSQLAKAYLAIPASQASTERLFSLAGLCISDRRTLLEPSVVENLLLLSSHVKHINCECCL
jgi:hypothetical protein